MSAYFFQSLLIGWIRIRRKRQPLSASVLAWLSITGVACAAALFAAYELAPKVLVVAVIGSFIALVAIQAQRRKARLTTISLVGFLALSLAAPLAAVINGEEAYYTLLCIWLVCALFFVGANLNVSLRLPKAPSLQAILFFHLIAGFAWTLIASGFSGRWAGLVCLLTNFLRFLWIWSHIDSFRRSTLRRIGLQETALSVLFIALNLAGRMLR